MNQKELNELRRRFRADRSNINHIYGCYINSKREVVSEIDASLGMMPKEETEMYLTLLKKTLSGSLGRNLVDIAFSNQQVMDSEEHRLLTALRKTSAQDASARHALYERIIDALDMEESSYLLLLAADNYDVPHKGRAEREDSGEVFSYIVCCVCPVKDPTAALRYFAEENEFHIGSTGYTVTAPALGFLFPAFDDRRTNIYNALYYTRDPSLLHPEMIDAVFRTQEAPMSAPEQQDAFHASLTAALEEECSLDIVQAVHEQISGRMQEHKESGDPEPLELTVGDVERILADSGVAVEKVESFREKCTGEFGEHAALIPGNIIDSRKFEVCTQEVKISVKPEFSYLVETRILDGRKYILIPADSGVEVNGIPVSVRE